jgi:hypothetical protein
MKKIQVTFFVFVMFAWACSVPQKSGQKPIQSDSTVAFESKITPVIDGLPNDECWAQATPYLLNQVWIPWGAKLDSADFYGTVKISWSEKENLLYFLVETTDDTLISGYKFSSSLDSLTYPDFDVVEVFIDEDKSGGLHVIDNGDSLLGKNGENAFAYHIVPETPVEGKAVHQFWGMDIAGNGDMKHAYAVDYKDHIPAFALRKTGNRYVWEFAVKVFNDSFGSQSTKVSPVQLNEGKLMGFSIAYCENDQNDLKRDNFIGSVKVAENRFNDHWIDASLFGKLLLKK